MRRRNGNDDDVLFSTHTHVNVTKERGQLAERIVNRSHYYFNMDLIPFRSIEPFMLSSS